jgi:tetratricopeptide (TPR) repeat protein
MIRMCVLLTTLVFAVPAIAQRTAADYLKLCEASSEKGDNAKAIGLCTKAIALNSSLEDAYMLRASLYKRQGDLDAAIADQTKLIELTSGMTMFLVYRAELYLLQNKADLALADLDRAIDKLPVGLYGARAYYHRGTINEARA